MSRAAPPRVTVLMPVYNTAAYLGEAIDSVLRQTFDDFELLVIDDGSTDGGPAVVEAFDDRRIRLERHASNRGLVETLNHGLDLARGAYIARMDSDDISHADRLRKQVAFMDRHPEIGICSASARGFGRDREVIFRYPEEHDEIKARLLFASSLVHAAAVLRADFIREHALRYDSRYPHAEDYRFWLEASSVTRLANLPEILYDYRLHESRVTRSHRSTQVESANRLRQAQLEQLGVDCSDKAVERHFRISTVVSLASSELPEAGEWLVELVGANDQRGVYPRRSLRWAVAEQWLQVCAASSAPDHDVWRVYRSFPMRKWRNTSMRRWFGIEKRLLDRRLGNTKGVRYI